MADTTITGLTADASVTGTEEIPVNDGGADKKVTVNQVKSFTLSGEVASLDINAAQIDKITVVEAALTYALTTDIDFDGGAERGLSLTGNVTFTTSNKGAGKTVTLYIACDATPRTFTFPAGWKFVGAAAPTGIAASKLGVLTLKCRGANDSNVVAAYAEEP